MSKIEIWAAGRPLTGVSNEQLITGVRGLFPNSTQEQLNRFVSGARFIVTRAPDEATAKRVVAALTKVGVACDFSLAMASPAPLTGSEPVRTPIQRTTINELRNGQSTVPRSAPQANMIETPSVATNSADAYKASQKLVSRGPFRTAVGKRKFLLFIGASCLVLLLRTFGTWSASPNGHALRLLAILFFVLLPVAALLRYLYKNYKIQVEIERLDAERLNDIRKFEDSVFVAASAEGGKPFKATVLGGTGFAFSKGDAVLVTCKDDNILLSVFGPQKSAQVVKFSDIVNLDITGPGTQRTSAKLVGGGFGVEGMLKGILIASAINKLTEKYKTNTFLRLSTRSGEVHFHITSLEPVDLRLILSPAIVQMEALRLKPQNASSDGVSGEVAKLHNLLQQGILSEEEFSAAKRRLLGAL